MIPLSLALVLAALTLLAWGLAAMSQALVWASIVASLAAAGCILMAVLQRRGQFAGEDAEALATPTDTPRPPAPIPPGPGLGGPRTLPERLLDPWPGNAEAPAAPAPDVPPAPRAGTETDPAATRPRTEPVPPARAIGRAGSPPSLGSRPAGTSTGDAAASTGGVGDAATAAGPSHPEPSPPSHSTDDLDSAAAPTSGPLDQPEPVRAAQATGPQLTRDPPDEPAIEQVAVSDALRIAQLDDAVLVVDGRPRYHQAGCPHLVGRPTSPLPVSTARRSGFTPCALCGPDAALLPRARGSGRR